ncbi:unnamed protein product [Rotaria sordida]|uniref:Uncharacterized protein n=1 Tax=Rotaria sordida TaxID=392033 RepID=A0A813NID4_9BILA|nr:unnamed protein product [Rotaria sordida]CAF0843649.1 unnamed protein product [Rotaria sordida]
MESFFEFFSGGYVDLTSVIASDLVGVNRMSKALRVVYLFQGVAIAINTPIVAIMRDRLKDFSQPYRWPYFIFGSSIILSGVILLAILILK